MAFLPDTLYTRSMSLYRRGRLWWSRVERNGQIIQRSTKCTAKSDARDVEAAWRTEAALGAAGLSSKTEKMILLGFESRFFAYLQNRVSRSTELFYRIAWRQLMSFVPLEHCQLTRIDENMIAQFVQHRMTQDVRPATVNNSLKTLRRALHLAFEWHMIQRIPKIHLLTGERSREFIITEEQLATMLTKATPVMKQLLPFLIDTGLRIGEATELTWAHVGLEPKEGAMRGWVFIAKGKTKASKRHIPLTARAAAILTERKATATTEYVWTLKKDKRLNKLWASRMFHRIAVNMGLPWDCVLHSTRHSFCTRLGESGADAFTIKQLAGHASILISSRYVHPTPKRMEDAIGMLEGASTT